MAGFLLVQKIVQYSLLYTCFDHQKVLLANERFPHRKKGLSHDVNAAVLHSLYEAMAAEASI